MITIPTLKSTIKCRKCGTPHGYTEIRCRKCRSVLPTTKDVQQDPTLGHIDEGDQLHAELISACCDEWETSVFRG